MIYGVFLVLFVSCVKTVDEFIPYETTGPIAQLQKLIANNSMNLELKSSEDHEISTSYGATIDVSSDILSNTSVESYHLHFIEMQTNQDYILHNVDHHSSRGAINSVYSFYIAIDDASYNSLSLSQDKYIEVKVPHAEITDPVVLGKGSFESGNLSWDYNDVNLNSNVSFEEWEEYDSDGSLHSVEGYVVKVYKSGWYNIASLLENATEFSSVCVSIPSGFNKDNTQLVILSQTKNYTSIIRIQDKEEGYHCSELIPIGPSYDYQLVSISQFEDGFYFDKTDVDLNASVQYLNPEKISLNDLKTELADL